MCCSIVKSKSLISISNWAYCPFLATFNWLNMSGNVSSLMGLPFVLGFSGELLLMIFRAAFASDRQLVRLYSANSSVTSFGLFFCFIAFVAIRAICGILGVSPNPLYFSIK